MSELEIKGEFNNDAPISSMADDRFARSPFAKKITHLCQSQTPKSRVIGIHAKWGEGKTSLLNMVGESLHNDILQIHFNPWYFKDEEQLLQAFFKTLADRLGKKLHTRKEEINNLIGEYGGSIGILETIPKASAIVTILKFLANLFKRNKKPTPEIAKNRINDFIIDSGLNIVIFIDDIDRLDAKEVGTVFKLVKLLADFPRTTYILAYDPGVVARMLAPSYGGIIPDSGYQFLEKLIQIPLPLPKAHDDSILSFVNETIEKVTKETGIDKEIDKGQIEQLFIDGLLLMLNNPRKIIRFANTLRFTYPILKGEVNMNDLFIIEALKVSMPEYFEFMKTNKELFLRDYLDETQNEYTGDRDNAIRKLNEILDIYPEGMRAAARNFTSQLFPRFAWTDIAEAKLEKRETLHIQKRICSEDYFDKYFTLTIKKEDIPDNHFNEFYLNTDGMTSDEVADQLKIDLKKFSLERIAFKVATYRHNIKSEHAVKLVTALCKLSDQLGEKRGRVWFDPFSMMSLAVVAMIKSLTGNQSFVIAKRIIAESTSMSFAAELVAKFVMPESPEKPKTLFSGNQAAEIKQVYIERLKSRIKEKGFFNAVPEEAMLRQLVWWNDLDHSEIGSIISDLLIYEHDAALKLLRIFTPTSYSRSTEPGEASVVKAEFTEADYERMESIIDPSRIYWSLINQYGNLTHLPSVIQPGYTDAADERTLIGKFQEFYHSLEDVFSLGSNHRLLDR